MTISFSGGALLAYFRPAKSLTCNDRGRSRFGRPLSVVAAWVTLLIGASLPLTGLAQSYVAGVRIDAPTNLIVGKVVPIRVQFTDSSGAMVAPEAGRKISVSPAGVYLCQVARCADSDYSEVFVTRPGQHVYKLYIRSLVTGFNALSITHPNGSSAQAAFDSRPAENRGNGAIVTPPNPENPSTGTPSQFELAEGVPSLQQGSCTTVRIELKDAAGNIAALSNARSVALAPGGGVHPSLDQCASYRNDPIVLEPGDTDFTFYAYVVSKYTGVGQVTISASGIDDLRIPFSEASGETPPPVAVRPVEPSPIEPSPIEPSPTEPSPVESTPVTAPPTRGLTPTDADVVVWVNDGGEKIVQEETRSFSRGTSNALWDGTTIRTFGARNEVVSFNVVVDNRGFGSQAGPRRL